MKTMKRFANGPALVALAMGLVALSAGTVGAALITVTNPSFEADVLADGGSTATTSGWTKLNAPSGTWNPLDANYAGATGGALPSPALGNQAAFVTASNYAYLKQTTGEAIEAGMTYTLTVAVGDRLNETPHDSFLLRLGYGTATYLTPIADNQPLSSALTDGAFTDFSVSFTAEAGKPYINQNLAILIGAQNNTGHSAATDFDNVRLTVIPEPSTIAVLSLAGIGVLIRRRRR